MSSHSSDNPHGNSRQYLDISAPQADWPLETDRRRVLLVAVNMPGYYSLAVRLLALVVASSDLAARVDIRYLEADNTANLPELAARLAAWQPDLVAWSVNIWNRMQVEELLGRLRPLLPQALFLFGGQEVSDSAVDFLARLPELDYLIEGEGEIALVQFLREWIPGGRILQNPLAVSGLRFRKEGQSVLSRPAETVSRLDELPSVILAGLIQPDQRNLLGVMLEGSRGCPNRCSFCFEGGRHGRVRSASMERLAQEAAYMAQRGAGYFHILDPILCNSNPERLQALATVLEELQRNNPRTVISVEIYAHQISEELTRCLQSCTIVDVGLQSTHEPTVRAIRRAWQPQRFKAGLARLRAARVPFNIYLICGLPEETLQTWLAGLASIMAERPTRIFCNELCLLNGTELRHRALEYGYHFDQNPPYRAWSNRWMSAAELRLAQASSKVVEKYYNLTVRAVHTKAPWLPEHAPSYGGCTRIDLASPCSRQCPGCDRGRMRHTAAPAELAAVFEQVQDDDVELVVGNGVEPQALVRLLGQLQLYAPARVRLIAPPDLFAADAHTGDWVQDLVHRGIWHFQSFADLGDDAAVAAEDGAIAQLTRSCRLTGFAVIRPFTEIVLRIPRQDEADAEGYCRRLQVLAALHCTVLSVPGAAEDMPRTWRERVAAEFDPLLRAACWLRLPQGLLAAALQHSIAADHAALPGLLAGLQCLALDGGAANRPPCFFVGTSAAYTRRPPPVLPTP